MGGRTPTSRQVLKAISTFQQSQLREVETVVKTLEDLGIKLEDDEERDGRERQDSKEKVEAKITDFSKLITESSAVVVFDYRDPIESEAEKKKDFTLLALLQLVDCGLLKYVITKSTQIPPSFIVGENIFQINTEESSVLQEDENFKVAVQNATECDLAIVILNGTFKGDKRSLLHSLPEYSYKENEGNLIIINSCETVEDDDSYMTIYASPESVFSLLLEKLDLEVPAL